MRSLIEANQLDWEVDSAGLSDWHEGEPPDPRAIAYTQWQGIDIQYQRSRPIGMRDFLYFEWILAMDQSNYSELHRISPPKCHAKIRLLMDFAEDNHTVEVPDPYYDGRFALAFDLIRQGCKGFVKKQLSSAP